MIVSTTTMEIIFFPYRISRNTWAMEARPFELAK